MFAASGSGGYDGAGVVCPFCREGRDDNSDVVSHVHVRRRVIFPGKGRGAARGRYGMFVRGDVTAIHFRCEEGQHEWALVLGEDKGAVFVRVVVLRSEPHDFEVEDAEAEAE
jgi:hypothetical protein